MIVAPMGTFGYRAPEMLEGKGYGVEVDWWAYGVLIYKLLFGKLPYDDNVMHIIMGCA